MKWKSPNFGLFYFYNRKMNEKAVSLIQQMLAVYQDFWIEKDFDKKTKDEITFSRWAVSEILEQILDHPMVLASETIWNFEFMCQLCIENAVVPEQIDIFSIARSTASKLFEEIERIEK